MFDVVEIPKQLMWNWGLLFTWFIYHRERTQLEGCCQSRSQGNVGGVGKSVNSPTRQCVFKGWTWTGITALKNHKVQEGLPHTTKGYNCFEPLISYWQFGWSFKTGDACRLRCSLSCHEAGTHTQDKEERECVPASTFYKRKTSEHAHLP